MAQTLKFGNKVWAAKEDSVLAYNDINNNYKPLPFSFSRASIGTRVNKDGLIETMGQDIARIDYTDSADGVLLLEPSRTNSLVQSNQFDTTWTLTNTSVISGQSGYYNTTDAWKIDISSAFAQVEQTVSNNGLQIFSVYAKAGTLNWIRLRVDHTSFSGTYFDIQNGEVGATVGTSSTSIENVGNGWYRCSIVVDNNVTRARIYPAIANNDLTATSGNIYIQNSQLEAGSYPTSYIPTSGSSVTRAAETCNNSGNSEVFNDSEGVLFADISALANDGTSRYISLSDGSSTNRINIFLSSSNTLKGLIRPGTGSIESNVNILLSNKAAYKYKSGDKAFWVNGFKIGIDTNAVMPSGLTELAFDRGDGGEDFYGKTKELGYYDTALTDAELETLTSYRNWVSMVNELNLNIIYNG
jgi:hypothetical protein